MPTVTLKDAALSRIVTNLLEDQRRLPNLQINEQMLDNIIREVADGPMVSRDQVRNQVASARTIEQKLEITKKGLDADEAKDLESMLGDPAVSKMMGPAVQNFFRAVIGVEPLNASLFGTDRVSRTSDVVTAETKRAVAELRDVIASGKLQAYYDASIGIGDASLKAKADALFEALPKVTSATSADEMVALGLWKTAPRGIEKMQTSARYLPGRQLIAPAKVNTDLRAGEKFLAWDDNGVDALTYRATLVGEQGDDFLVKIDGKDDPIAIPKAKIFERNQPNVLEGDRITISGKTADYSDKFVKAKICEAAIKMDDIVGRIDFTKRQGAPQGGGLLAMLGLRNNGPTNRDDLAALQRKAVGVVHDVIDMKYRKPATSSEPGRDGGSDVGRLAVKGVGVCTEQAAVMGALLAPFQDLLGIDIAMISGGVYRNTDRSAPMADQFRRFQSPAHGWIQVTYRPSMEMRIIDRTWQQKDHPADRAYSPGGDRYPTRYQSAIPVAAPEATDVVLDGSVSVQTFDRQFGVVGVDDRTNHMSNRDDHT